MIKSEIRDPGAWESGELKISWVRNHMPLLEGLDKEFKESKPFKGLKVALSVHLEAKTARLCEVLAHGGAEMFITGSNPLSTQDDVAAALVHEGLNVFAVHGATPEEYESGIRRVIEAGPNIIIDDGGDLVTMIHDNYPELIPNVIVDNRYGTGQSVWDGINRTTNLIVAGKDVVVAGYGWCGKGVAMRAKGLGARVIVTEVDPIKAMEAVMDGFRVMSMKEAAPIGDIFVTVTGCEDVITKEHFLLMKDGAICCNAGHFDCEVSVRDLKEIAVNEGIARANIQEYALANGRKVYVIAEGRLVNLAAGDGHPAEIMDMSFAIQALSANYLVENKAALRPLRQAQGPIGEQGPDGMLHNVPAEVDNEVACRKLADWGITIDKLTDKQRIYLYGE